MSKPTKTTDMADGSAGIVAAATRLKPTTDSAPLSRTVSSKVAVTYVANLSAVDLEAKAEFLEARKAHRSRDVLARLNDWARRVPRPAFKGGWSRTQYSGIADDVDDVIEEIEWLRAARPEAVRRGDLVAMADQLRTMQATIAAMLAQLETAIEPLPAPAETRSTKPNP